jgi:hypothetical protein
MTATDEVQATLHLLNSDRYAESRAAPGSLVELLARHAQGALEVSGAEQTAWNGHVVEAGEGILGLAQWDGTLHLDRECILEPMREMYSHSGEPQSDGTLVRYREALVTMLHEQSHFLGPAGATQEAARAAFKQPGSRALEEGVAEAWAHDHLNDYLDRLGVDMVAPGITHVRSDPSYQAFVPAVRVLTSDLERRAGLPSGELLQALNRQTAEGQWPMIVDVAYRSSRLPECVPADREPAVRLRLENMLRASFEGLEAFEGLPKDLAAARSKSTGRQCVTRLQDELSAAEDFFQARGEHSPGTDAIRAPAQPLSSAETAFRQALSGLAPPDSSTAAVAADVAHRARPWVQQVGPAVGPPHERMNSRTAR